MVGARLADPDTVIEKGGSEALDEPSLTLMTMFEVVPMERVEGVPDNLPVEELKFAHLGLLLMEYVSVWPSESEAEGWNTYDDPTVAAGEGTPEIVGA
jgi:hypothetical protein